MRNKADQALVEWPKGHLHSVSTAIQRKEVMKWRKKMFASVCGSQDFRNPIALLVLQSESLGSCSGVL